MAITTKNKLDKTIENIKENGQITSKLADKVCCKSLKKRTKIIRVRWLHKKIDDKKFIKMKKPLGGIIKLKLDISISYIADEIKQLAIQKLSDNHANYTIKDQFFFNLGFYDGHILIDFTRLDGTVCDIWEYCEIYNTTPYSLNLFLLSSTNEGITIVPRTRFTRSQLHIIKNENDDNVHFTVKDNYHIFYHCVKKSKYSNEFSYIESEKGNLHAYFLEDKYGDESLIEEFEPLDYGYAIAKLEMKNKVLLRVLITEESTKQFNFPSATTLQINQHCIVHDTDELQGFCDGTFGIGFIPSCTNTCHPIFTWYKDSVVYKKGEFLYWLNNIHNFSDSEESHIWCCSVTCQENKHQLKSKIVEVNNKTILEIIQKINKESIDNNVNKEK